MAVMTSTTSRLAAKIKQTSVSCSFQMVDLVGGFGGIEDLIEGDAVDTHHVTADVVSSHVIVDYLTGRASDHNSIGYDAILNRCMIAINVDDLDPLDVEWLSSWSKCKPLFEVRSGLGYDVVELFTSRKFSQRRIIRVGCPAIGSKACIPVRNVPSNYLVLS